jgi:hypothetical protein
MSSQQTRGLHTDIKLQRFTDDDGGLISTVNVKSIALAKLKSDKEVCLFKLIEVLKI